MNPENEGRYISRAFRCYACTPRSQLQAQKEAQPGNKAGLFYTIEERGG